MLQSRVFSASSCITSFGQQFFSLPHKRLMSCLVFSEHNNSSVSPSTLSTITAATALSSDITVLVSGYNVQEVAHNASKIAGVNRVLVQDSADLATPVAEQLTELLKQVQQQHSFSYILGPASTVTKNFFPRFSAISDVAQISEIIRIVDKDTFVRPIYAGNVFSTVKSKDQLKVITVRATNFEKALYDSSSVAEILPLNLSLTAPQSKFISQEISKSDRPELTAANVVVSGGRGMDSGENFKMLYDLADLFKGAVGASRAAVEAGFVPNELQVGQTGKVVAPDLYIAVGISGAIQHLAGMKDSKTIVAINKDPDAPIFQVADFGLVGDLFNLVPELSEKVSSAKKEKQ